MTGFAFRYQFDGYVSDAVLAKMVGQETTVTGVMLGADSLPVQLGRYRIAGVTRITAPPYQGGLNATVVMIHMDLIDTPPGAAPSGEEPEHAHPDPAH